MKKLIAFILFSLNAYAGDGGLVGNGGGAVVCYDTANTNTITSIEVLDLYEARVVNNQELDPAIQKTGDWKILVQLLIERMGKVSEMRRQLYSQYFSHWEQEVKFLNNVNLGDVKDAQYIAIPIGCKLEMVILQSKPRIPSNPRYFINEKLWNSLDDFNKAVLVLHELIYREVLVYGHDNSIRVRLLNSFLQSKNWNTLVDPFEIQELFRKLNFEYTDLAFQVPGGLSFEAPMYIYWEQNFQHESIKLQDRLIVKIGKCLDSCKVYELVAGGVSQIAGEPILAEISFMDLQFDLKLNDYFETSSYNSDVFGFRIRSLSGEISVRPDLYDPEDTKYYFHNFKIIGKLKNKLNAELLSYPTSIYDLKKFYISDNSNYFSLESKSSITFEAPTTNDDDMYIKYFSALKDSYIRWNYNLNQGPQYECNKIDSGTDTSVECGVDLIAKFLRNRQRTLKITKQMNGIAVDSKNRFIAGGKSSSFISNEQEIICENEEDCLQFSNDILNKQAYISLNSNAVLHDSISDYRFPVMSGNYQLYPSLNVKYILLGHGVQFSCVNISNGKYSKLLNANEPIFFLEDGKIDIEKTCGPNPINLEKLIQTTNQFYINALKGTVI